MPNAECRCQLPPGLNRRMQIVPTRGSRAWHFQRQIERDQTNLGPIVVGAVREWPSGMVSKEIAVRARTFGRRIIELHEKLTRKGGPARGLASQVLDSGTSIGANLEEATAGQTKPDFITKVCIARKGAREVVYWLKLLVESGLVDLSEIAWELDEGQQLVRILTTIIINARSNPNRG